MYGDIFCADFQRVLWDSIKYFTHMLNNTILYNIEC